MRVRRRSVQFWRQELLLSRSGKPCVKSRSSWSVCSQLAYVPERWLVRKQTTSSESGHDFLLLLPRGTRESFRELLIGWPVLSDFTTKPCLLIGHETRASPRGFAVTACPPPPWQQVPGDEVWRTSPAATLAPGLKACHWGALCPPARVHRRTTHDPDNHDGVITHLLPDILECKVKWALGSITTNKASGGDGIRGDGTELFQILKYASKSGKLSSGQRNGKGQLSFQSQR